jgi:hypothetical protein
MDEEKSKMKKQIGKNKDQATSTEGNWAKAKVRKTINGTYAPNIGHPTSAEEVGVKPYLRNYMVHTMLKLEYLMPLLPNPTSTSFASVFEGRCSTTNVVSTHYRETVSLFVGNIRPTVERISSLYYNLLLHPVS